MKRVLITGATGFIGQHCIPLLQARDYEIHAVSSKKIQESLSGVQLHQVDLLDLEQVAQVMASMQPTHLLHFAWYTTPGNYWTSLENLRWVQASLALLQAFAKNGGRRVVMAGTCAEYDWKYGYCSEQTTPLSPSTLYGVCKHSLQIMLHAFAKQTDLSAAWGRIFFLYGPYEQPSRLVPSVVRSLLQGESARCSHGNQIRDFLYVRDVAGAFTSLLESDISGAVNIASGYPITLRDVIYKIAQKLNRPDLLRLGALPAPENEPRLLLADVSRLTDELSWKPRYNLDQGLEQTIDWWRSYFERRNRASE